MVDRLSTDKGYLTMIHLDAMYTVRAAMFDASSFIQEEKCEWPRQ